MTRQKGKKANKKNPTGTTKKDWGTMKHREEGKEAFLKALRLNADERKCCVDDPAYAKERFAFHGNFDLAEKGRGKGTKLKAPEPIPESTEFRVFEKFPIKDRDQLVTIVLPGPGKNEFIAQDWRCTYTPWASSKKKKKSPKAKRATSSPTRPRRSKTVLK